jgi:hypothetical protein
VRSSRVEPVFGLEGVFDRTSEETTVALRHTPCPPSTALADC